MKIKSDDNIINRYFPYSMYALFFLLPWYKFPNGRLQPVDMTIVGIAALLFLNKGFFKIKSGAALSLLIVLIYLQVRYAAAFSQGINTAAYLIAANSYYLTVFTVFFAGLFYLYTSRPQMVFCDIVLNSLLITTILPLLTVLIFGSDYGLAKMRLTEPTIVRPVLTFNNPNQIGFFALVNLSIFFYMGLLMRENGIKIKKGVALLVINLNLFFLLLSVNRAAAPAIILYIFSYFLIFNIGVRRHFIFVGMFISVAVGVMLAGVYAYHHLLLVNTGIASAIRLKVTQDFYLRAIQGADYNCRNVVSFLLGEGSMTNPLRIDGAEFHNNFVSLFNQAGLLGLLLYFYALIKILYGLCQKGFLYTLPFFCYLFYSNMHYAFRSRENWLFFAVVVFILSVSTTPGYRAAR